MLAANSSNTLCAGDPLALTATLTLPSGCLLNTGTPYIFSGPGTPGAIASNATAIGGAGAGSYTVSVNIADDGTGTCPCTSGPFTTTVVGPSNSIVVNASPGAPTIAAFAAVCEGETLTVTANHSSGPSGTFNWYSNPGGTNLVFTGNPFTTSALTIGDNFYVGETASGCESGLTAVNPTINPNPTAPVAINDTICPDNAAILSTTLPTGGSTQNWWDASIGGSQLGSGVTYTTPLLAQTTIYYAEAVLSATGCLSTRTAVTAVVLPRITNPIAPNIRICEGETGVITAIGTGAATSALLWYDVQIAGTPLKVTPMPVPPNVPEDTLLVGPFLVGSYLFYVAEYDSTTGCESERTAVTVFVGEAVPEPQADDREICEGDTLTLAANYGAGSNFGDFYWWNDTTAGTLLQIGQNYAPPLSLMGSPGVYDFWVEEQYQGCTSPTRDRVTVTVLANPADPATAPDTICMGQAATIIATLGTPGNILEWFADGSGVNLLGSGGTYTTSGLNQTTTFYVRERNPVMGCVSGFVSVTVVVNALPTLPSAGNVSVCENQDGIITATGTGAANTRLDLYDASNSFVQSGATGAATVNFNIGMLGQGSYTYFVEEVDIAGGCISSRISFTVTVQAAPANPLASGVSICSGEKATLTGASGGGTSGTVNWYSDVMLLNLISTGSSFTTPVLSVTTTYYATETVGVCEGLPTSVTVTINPLPADPTVANDTICTGQTASLSATGSGGNINWYDNASGNTLLFTGGTFTTPILNQTTTYWVREQTVGTGCQSGLVAVLAVVNPIPATPSANSITVCENVDAIIVASGSGTVGNRLDLYTSTGLLVANGTSGSSLGENFNLGMMAPTTYNYLVEEIDLASGCASARTAVTVTVIAAPAIPSVIPVAICSGEKTTLTATSGGGTLGTFNWYSDISLTNLLITGSSYTTPALTANTTYYVTEVLSGCEGNAFASTVTLNPNPASPIVANDTICTGQTASLSATGSGGNLNWYDNASGNTLLFTGGTFTTPILNQTTTYWVREQTVGTGCQSGLVAVLAVVNPIPAAPSANSITVCENVDAIIVASGSGTVGNRLDLYTSTGLLVANGTSGSSLGENFNLGMMAPATYNYLVEEIDLTSGCASARTAVTVTVIAAPAIPVVAPVTICVGFSATLNASSAGGTAGDFNWYDDPTLTNLLFTGTTFTTPLLTVTTTYYVTEVLNGCEGAPLAVMVTISAAPADPVAMSDTVCSGQQATLSASSTVGVLNWYNNSGGTNLLATGPIYTTPILTQTTTYWVQEVIVGTGCASNLVPVLAVVNPIPPVPSASSISICDGDSLVFLASGSGNPNTQLNIYSTSTGGIRIQSGTPGVSSVQFNLGLFAIGTYTFYIEEEDLRAGCTSQRKSVTATVSPKPLPPNVSGVTICQGQSAMLTAVSSGGTGGNFEWYQDSLTTNLLFSGSTFTTGILLITEDFWVTEVLGGCESAPTRVTVTVDPKPADPIVVPANICLGQSATLIAVGVPGNNINWYDNPLGNNLLFTGNSFVTPPLTQTTTYWVRQQVPGTGCASNLVAVVVTILPLPTPPSAGDITICEGEVGIITATGSGVGSLRWYNSATFATPIRVDGMPPASATLGVGPFAGGVQVFYVDEFNGACASTRTSISVSILPAPSAPLARDTTVCQGTAATLVAQYSGTSTGIFNWYDSSGMSLLFSGNNFNTGPLNSTTVYIVTEQDSICESAGTVVIVSVDPRPSPPVVVTDTVCDGEMAVLSATGAGGNILNWYDDPNGTNLLFTGALFTTPALNQTTTYYVQQIPVGSGCGSSLVPVTVVVNPLPFTPSATTIRICEGAIGVITASGTGNANTQLNWYDNATFTIPVKVSPMPPSSDTLQVGPFVAGTYTYYIEEESTLTGCKSMRSAVSVIVSPQPSQPSVNDTTICEGNSVTLLAPGVGVFNWYDAPVGGNLLQVGLSFTTPILNTTTTYYVSFEVNGCESQRETVVVNVRSAPASPTISSNSPICEGDTLFLVAGFVSNVSYQWTGPNGFSSPLQNPLILNANLVLNQGTYSLVITDLATGCSSQPQSLVVLINPRPATPTLQTNSPVCDGDDLVLTVAAVNGAIYNWSGPNGFLGTTMVPTLTVSAVTIADAGTYEVTITLNGCPSQPGTISVSIIAPPPKPVASNNGPLCEGDNLALTASGSGAGQYSWTGPNSFSSNQQSPIIQNVTVVQAGDYIVSFVAVNGCANPRMDTTSVVINILPPSVVVISNSPVCEGDSIELFAPFVPNVTYRWTGPSGFTSAVQNPVIKNIREIDDQGDYVLVITDTITGCSGPPNVVFVDVLPGIPINLFILNSGPVCIGRDVQLTVNTVSNATYFWVGPNGFLSNTQNPLLTNATLADSGVYTVTVSVTGQCVANATASTTVVVGDGLPVDAGPDITISEGANAQLMATGGVIYSWTPNTFLDNPNISNPIVEMPPTGIYTYIVMGTDVGGCNGRDTVVVTVLDGGGNPPVPTPAELGIYDLFTPNGDGVNDFWVIDNLAMLGSHTLSLFNRGGVVVLTTTDYNSNWDGTYQGKDLPEGTYWYVIRASIGEIKGAVTLVR
ncbi:gliding motility-associated C-terminal domain-containing protein [bacterium]|nr:gliding motility-associated C-terminal domain-containing protein [bacterium]